MATKKSTKLTSAKPKKVFPEFDRLKAYSLDEALKLLATMPAAKFDESVDVALNLGVDPKYNDQMVRGVVSLPHGNGKTVRVAVFAKGAAADEAKAAGADVVGLEDLIAKVEAGNIDFDRVIATPDCMPQLGKIARILGPKGMMPNPKLGTVTPNVAKAVKDVKGGMIEFKVEKAGIIHAGVGKRSFSADKLSANIKALVDAVKAAKPSGAKSNYMLCMAICATQSPAIKVDLSSL
ncbi:MAG: 50S ribosomal protein L1 [Blastochloris viridis]|uniref:Large ribosomal subunit protein uL1 n=1 Tax=Blastochloris viridis TaxID=1079 RepID=A0A6N4RCS0_BLAVI|nr:MAG: 50S ribosomal protein L1 [Blastochloris viridis]